MKAADFYFHLPEGLIAKKPSDKRDLSKLLVLHKNGEIEHRTFSNLPAYLNEGDLLLLNNTKVFPARLAGIKPTGGRFEFLLVKEIGIDKWEILSRGKYRGGISIAEGFSANIENQTALFSYSGDLMENLWRYGDMPLPPYIKRKPEPADREWYQTVYAEKEGSIAAPTAGLHFTGELIGTIKDKGVKVRRLTLHVGIGTFKLIKTENLSEHSMDAEYFEIGKEIIEEIQKTKASGKRVFSVGTTTTRAIEGYLSGKYSPIHSFAHSPAQPICGYTNIFIYPGFEFKAVDSLITNFHLPRSTPLMLASAFCGAEKLSGAYSIAVSQKYRFFSYGDAMLIL
ncbi:MAG: tRNA preQ1(34) S-adenosylmethionine ribosyltransferase-isomerase QueA [Nitrospirae bacterium]|nr:tRNA preQ1(34) S-adenosylmethionine ribosyltransferase-isomerase QueA [Nitrospirota bacterium]MBI3378469.1 tRNA preQ1(34) S-adenosylmethionine ribosyltransferase-isomerase QueA [Nitrospirota bacterium]